MFGMMVVGLLAGAWWPLITYIIYFLAVFNVVGIRFLCTHRPYYAEESKTLHCLGNHSSPKLWRYHPEPMNKLERFAMIFLVIAVIFFILPLLVLGYGIGYIALNYHKYGLISLLGLVGITVAILLSSITFVSILKIFFRSTCVNFSCPLYTVPKYIVDEYIRINDVMRRA